MSFHRPLAANQAPAHTDPAVHAAPTAPQIEMPPAPLPHAAEAPAVMLAAVAQVVPVPAPAPAPVAQTFQQHRTIPARSAAALAPTQRALAPAPSQPVVTDFKQVATLPYNAEANESLSAEWRHMFAVMGANNAATLLVDVDALRRPVLFEVQRRMGEIGVRIMTRQPVTGEVVKLVHQGHSSSGSNRMGDHERAGGDTTQNEKMIFSIVDDAVTSGASDIHIETRETHADIFFRINGTRILQTTVSRDAAQSMCSVLYSVHGDATSKDVSWSKDAVQDTAIEHASPEGARVQLRFSSAPIFPAGNFHAVIRVLVMDAKVNRKLEALGYFPAQYDAIVRFLLGSSGLVLLTGPTNSGKSTTMQALVHKLFERRGTGMKLISVEDPVEYVMPGACQIGVPRGRTSLKAESDSSVFTTYLRGSLRQDPDAVIVGEIRDSDSAEVTRDLVLAGRKVVTTLHTYSALWSFVRLRELGVPYELLTMPGFISGIIYQRLLPKLCPHCSLRLEEGRDRLPNDVIARLMRVTDMNDSNVRVRGDGCEHCNHTGYVGRLPVCEIVVPDGQLLKLIAEGDLLGAEAYWRQNAAVSIPGGGVTALAHAIHQMNLGLVDPNDVEIQIASLDKDLTDSFTAPSLASLSSHPGQHAFGQYATLPATRPQKVLSQRDFGEAIMDQVAL